MNLQNFHPFAQLPDRTPLCLILHPVASAVHKRFNNYQAACNHADHPGTGLPGIYDSTIPENADAAIVLGILKYGAVIVIDPPSLPSQKALLTLRQNIYTDPRSPSR